MVFICDQICLQPLKKLIKRLAIRIFCATQQLVPSDLPEFGNNPNNLRIDLPRRITNPERMFIDDVYLGPGEFLVALTCYPSKVMRHRHADALVQRFDPRISIGDRVTSTSSTVSWLNSELNLLRPFFMSHRSGSIMLERCP